MVDLNRRGFLSGLAALCAAAAVPLDLRATVKGGVIRDKFFHVTEPIVIDLRGHVGFLMERCDFKLMNDIDGDILRFLCDGRTTETIVSNVVIDAGHKRHRYGLYWEASPADFNNIRILP